MREKMMHSAILFLLVLSASRDVQCDNIQEQVEELFQNYYKWKLETCPTAATELGLHDYAEDVEDESPEGLKKIQAKCQEFKDRAGKILSDPNSDDLETKEKFYVKIIDREVSHCLKWKDHKGYLFAEGSFLYGLQTKLPQFFGNDNYQKLDSLEDYRTSIRRLQKIPKQIDQVIELLQQGVKEGITYANGSMSRVKDQFEKLQVESADESEFYKQFKKMAEKLQLESDSPKVTEIQNEAKDVIENVVLPAFKKMDTYIQDEYMRHLRPSAGIRDLPNGLEMYQGFLEYHTSKADITPDEIHQIGLNEVSDLEKKLAEEAEKLGYKNLEQKEFLEKIRNEKSQQFSSKTEILQHFEELVSQINSKLPQVFGPEVLKPEVLDLQPRAAPPSGGTFAYYMGPSLDGKRRGSFYVNLEKVESWKRYDTMALTLHEGNPGHNLQITYATSSQIPHFLNQEFGFWSHPASTPTYNAFIEGWALYCELLGHELGLYQGDPYQSIGFYSFNLLRASRLVVDTGLHAKGWSREDAIDYLLAHTALSYQHVEAEVDRYITWPGQAVAYKIGERHIRKLRKDLESEFGQKFDLKDFHRSLLDCYGPLATLEECVRFSSTFTNPLEDLIRKPKSAPSSKGHKNDYSLLFVPTLFILYKLFL